LVWQHEDSAVETRVPGSSMILKWCDTKN